MGSWTSADAHPGFTLAGAVEWRAAGFNAYDAQSWDWVASLGLATTAAGHGYAPAECCDIADALVKQGGTDTSSWLETRLPADYIVLCIEAGISVAEAVDRKSPIDYDHLAFLAALCASEVWQSGHYLRCEDIISDHCVSENSR